MMYVMIFILGVLFGVFIEILIYNYSNYGILEVEDKGADGIKFRFVFAKDLEDIHKHKVVSFRTKVKKGENV